MNQFQHAYDAMVAAYAAYQDAAEAIEARFEAGDVDGALELQGALDEAHARAESVSALYRKLTAVESFDPRANFVPAQGEPENDENQPQVLSREEFDRLTPYAKAEFVAQGGEIVDQTE